MNLTKHNLPELYSQSIECLASSVMFGAHVSMRVVGNTVDIFVSTLSGGIRWNCHLLSSMRLKCTIVK